MRGHTLCSSLCSRDWPQHSADTVMTEMQTSTVCTGHKGEKWRRMSGKRRWRLWGVYIKHLNTVADGICHSDVMPLQFWFCFSWREKEKTRWEDFKQTTWNHWRHCSTYEGVGERRSNKEKWYEQMRKRCFSHTKGDSLSTLSYSLQPVKWLAGTISHEIVSSERETQGAARWKNPSPQLQVQFPGATRSSWPGCKLNLKVFSGHGTCWRQMLVYTI